MDRCRPFPRAATRDERLGRAVRDAGGLSPLIGVFVAGSDVIRQAGSGAVCCFAAPVLLGVAMASVYAELGSALPSAGGEYSIAARLLGADAGFAMLALNLLGLCLAVSLCSLGTAGCLQAARSGVPLRPAAMAIVAAVTGLAVLRMRVNAVVTGLRSA